MTSRPTALIMLDAESPTDRSRWVEILDSWPQSEVFAHPEYLRLYVDGDSRAMCASFESEQGKVLFPFLLRQLRGEPNDTQSTERLHDIITPYGYGGPFVWASANHRALADEFWPQFDVWARNENVVSEFIRFSLFQNDLLPYRGQIEAKQENVVRSLGMSTEDTWMDFEHKVRKNVNKARRSGLDIHVDLDAERFEDFYRIYVGTMDRRDANDGYYFPREYFETIHRDLVDKFAYFHALLDGEVVSTELVLLSKVSAYSFLGGTESDAFSLRPNDLLKFEIMKWCRESGRENYVLGGGFEAEDGIFKYKLAFAPSGRVPFSVGTRIHDQSQYERLVESRAKAQPGWQPVEGYFPLYRS